MSERSRLPSVPPPVVHDMEWSEAPYIAASGVCMGSADVVPGVSGGTMAVALGIYRRLLAAIESIDSRALRALISLRFAKLFELVHWRFLVTLVAGIGAAVVIMVKVVKLPHLIDAHPSYVYGAFFGLVLASALVLVRRLPHWTPAAGASLVVGVGLGFAIVNLVPVQTPENPLFVFLCGALAICAMILPGISGSFVLLILGKYEYVIGALGHLDLMVIVPFAAGCAAGLLSFARLLGWMLDRWHDPMVAMLTGLLIGSLWRIWPYQHLEKTLVRGKMRVIEATPFWPESFELSVLLLLIAGFVAVTVIEQLAARRQRGQPAQA